MNISESKRFDLNSEPIASFFQRVVSDIKGYAQLNIDEQDLINRFSTWHGKHPLEFTRHAILDYQRDLVKPEEMKQILICPFPCKSSESAEEKQKYKDDMTMISSEPVKSFFELVINDLIAFVTVVMEKKDIPPGRHPAHLVIDLLNSYQKDITFSPKL